MTQGPQRQIGSDIRCRLLSEFAGAERSRAVALHLLGCLPTRCVSESYGTICRSTVTGTLSLTVARTVRGSRQALDVYSLPTSADIVER
jgi:hypothetical protein